MLLGHIRACYGYICTCEILFSTRANKYVRVRVYIYYISPAVCCAVCRRYEVARLLGQHGADVNLRGKSGSTAFDIANMLGECSLSPPPPPSLPPPLSLFLSPLPLPLVTVSSPLQVTLR